MSDAESGNDTPTKNNQKETATKEKPKPNPKNSQMQNQFQEKAGALQKKKQTRGPQTGKLQKHVDDQEEEDDDDDEDWPEPQMPARHGKHRMVPVHQSRIADRPYKEVNSAVKIKIELDLEVEVEIYARVKGDVMIGLM
ncbi:hypothetical protein EJ08DRAFT_648703 [Tothia fuscella]|uniref:Uncharacterized protein n=1 Tax=Tothia fuscella TaxID=1048955 RepID=A0A9P4NU97_9PEZI|nr:hypothetical protein EJ08DRAFT_648703 [Tothia fuscella]